MEWIEDSGLFTVDTVGDFDSSRLRCNSGIHNSTDIPPVNSGNQSQRRTTLPKAEAPLRRKLRPVCDWWNLPSCYRHPMIG